MSRRAPQLPELSRQRTSGPLTDRQTILALDPEFNDWLKPISLLPAAPLAVPARLASINATGSTITIPITNGPTLPALPAMSIFKVGEIYFFTSGVGAPHLAPSQPSMQASGN